MQRLPSVLRLLPSLSLILGLSAAPLLADDAAWQSQASSLNAVSEVEDSLRWGGDEGFALVGMEDDWALVETNAGVVRVHRELFDAADDQALHSLRQLSALAAEADLSGGDGALTLEHDLLSGWRLNDGPLLVTAHGVLTQVSVDSDRQDKLAAVRQHADAMREALEQSAIGRHARSALNDLIGKLDQEDTSPVTDEVNPRFARKVVSDGWLIEALDGLGEPAQALTDSVRAVTALQPHTVYEGHSHGESDSSLRLAHYSDAWGTGSALYQHADGVRYASQPPLPMYHWPLQGPDGFAHARVVVELPPGSDPIAKPQLLAEPLAATLYHKNTQLARWTAEEGLHTDMEVWRSVVPDQHSRLSDHIVSNYMPPHIVLRDGSDHIHLILTKNGVLRPVQDDSREEAERFLDDAARILPDAAHLDLISQYILKYVYDSPDPTMPLLLGTREAKSDIHQTAFETLSTTIGGVCRGDCDDLAELMEHIVERQGRLGHMISLPGHAALAWAEEFDDQWHVFLMQTGPTLQFSDERLQDALRATYRSFDASDTFDPNGVGLLLRFSGENTRSPWRLSYRIFSEPDYAETMIDVQKDWHYQTYLQGINKMLELIESGDEDTANFRELAGLYAFTAQHNKAVQYHEWAMERTDEDESRLLMGIEMLMHLHDAEQYDELKLLAEDILERQLPPLRQQLGQSIVQVGLQLTGALARYDHPSLAAQALRDSLGTSLGRVTQNVAQWSRERYNPEAWRHSQELRMIDRILGWHSQVLSRLIEADREQEGAIKKAVPELQHFIDLDAAYRRDIAFNGSYDGGDLASSYALQGRHLEARMGREALLAALEEAPMPTERIEHRDRELADDALKARDLQWIKASVAFWNNLVLGSLGDIREDALTREEAAAIRPQLEAAVAAADDLGMGSTRTDYQAHFAMVILAMITEDRDLLSQLLQHVREQNDKRLTDYTAQYMGDVAYALDLDWFRESVEMWRDIVDHKPKYLWIAWRAAVNHAPQHALIAAGISAERFADDQAFVDEYAFMQQLFARQQSEAEAAAGDSD